MNLLPVDNHLRTPRACKAIVCANTFEAGGVVTEESAVVGVLRSINFAQIHETIIGAVSVNVIDLDRKPAKKDEPNNAMREVVLTGECYLNVPARSLRSDTPGDAPLLSTAPLVTPAQIPGFLAIIKLATRDVGRHVHDSESRKNEQEQREREAQRTRDDEKKDEEQRAYIEQRLREIAAFEDRLRPGQAPRRKRN